MRTTSKHSQLKKTPAGESGSASCSPLPDPGTVNTDPAGAYYMTYQEQLKSPKWQEKRLRIMERDNFTCQNCGSKTDQLNVHHYFYYTGFMAWEYEDDNLITLCNDCHEWFHIQMDVIKCVQTFIINRNSLKELLSVLMYLRYNKGAMERLLIEKAKADSECDFERI